MNPTTTEPQSRKRDGRIDDGRAPRGSQGWMALAAMTGLAVFVLAGWWWNLRRPENCYRRARQILQGRAALQPQNRQTVRREARRLIGTPGFESQGRLLSGLLLVREERPVDALQELQYASRSEATAVEALTAAAGCYYVLGQFVQAIQTARATLGRDEEALDARRWLAAAYYDLGATADAVGELAIIAVKAPHDPRPDRLLGLIDKDNERFTEAVGHYRESLRRDPRQPERGDVLMELAESLVKLNLYDEAQETLRECDRSAPVLTLAAECELSLGRIEQAQDRLREALELDPLYFPAKLKRGTMLLLLHRADEAVAALKDAVRQAPYSSEAHFHLSQAYLRRGERDQAELQLRLREETVKVEQQFSKLHEAASLQPNDPDVRVRLGVLAGKLGKPELARLWFRSALAIKPDHPGARSGLAEAAAP